MKRWWPKVLLLLLLSQVQVGALLLGQATNRPFVRKFEAGYPNFSYFTSIWPTQDGWWGLFTKTDSVGPGAYYYGAEAAVIDSNFNVTSRVNYGDTTRYYFGYPGSFRKSNPDGKGNFWYWMTGYTRADRKYHLFYGKMDMYGVILFEKEFSNPTEYDYFYEFLALPQGGGVFFIRHFGRFAYLTSLNWVDSLGNVMFRDSIERIGSSFQTESKFTSFDSSRGIVLVPSADYYSSSTQTYNMQPRISLYTSTGTLLQRNSLASQLQDNAIANLYRTDDGGYVGSLMEYKYDSTAVYETHRPGIVKLDSNFNVIWKKYLFPPKDVNDAFLFHRSPIGDFFLSGWSDNLGSDTVHQREWFITKFSSNLDSLWTRFYNLGGDTINDVLQIPTQIQVRDNGDILVLVDNSGYWPPSAGFINYTTLYKLDSLGCLIGNCAIGDTVVIPPDTVPPVPPDTLWPDPAAGILVYPNPSAGAFSMVWDVAVGDVSTMRVYDVAGRILLRQATVRKEQPTALDLRDYAPGVYFLEIVSEKGRKLRAKVLVLH
jgi:hypothetical protein